MWLKKHTSKLLVFSIIINLFLFKTLMYQYNRNDRFLLYNITGETGTLSDILVDLNNELSERIKTDKKDRKTVAQILEDYEIKLFYCGLTIDKMSHLNSNFTFDISNLQLYIMELGDFIKGDYDAARRENTISSNYKKIEENKKISKVENNISLYHKENLKKIEEKFKKINTYPRSEKSYKKLFHLRTYPVDPLIKIYKEIDNLSLEGIKNLQK